MCLLEQTLSRCSTRNKTWTLYYRGSRIELGVGGSNITVVWMARLGECPPRHHFQRRLCPEEEFFLAEWFLCLSSDQYQWPSF